MHPQELATYLLSYFMSCAALVRCVLVLYPYPGGNNSTNKSQAPEDGCINIRNMLIIK